MNKCYMLRGEGGIIVFNRKALVELKEWKDNYAPEYAALLEGARRVGKSTIAEEFAKNNYRSYIKVSRRNTI